MRIVVLDGYTLNPGDLSWEELEKRGDVIIYDRTKPDDVCERIKDADIILVNKVPLTRETILKCNAKYIGVLATGYNVIDIIAAREKGICVTNIPTYGTNSVAQMAFAHVLNIFNQVGLHSKSVEEGEWERCSDWCYWKTPLSELYDKTIGIIGYGRIGQAVGNISQAFGMKVLAYDQNKIYELESETLKYVDLDELLAKSDIISVHCPLFENTYGIINKENINKMKDGVVIINNSRGELIVEKDLADALNSGKVYAAGLDVVSKEPIKAENPLLNAKNVYITPHISWATREARERLMDIAISNIDSFAMGNPVNVVNN